MTGHWTTTYDCRAAEQRLNPYAQSTTRIDGADVASRTSAHAAAGRCRRAGRCQPSVLRATPATVQVLSGRWAASGLSGRHWRR
ncbi:hypothetical protein ACWDOR_36155 [Streptosporangium canum]|uniref:hypothetical protein n=1 Tax=Streptosporangium canum TaxID=324952 RepID=UPI0036A31A91